ncbi:hypothetical protein PGN61_20955 [Klebsiella aerogenes]
MNIFKSDLMKPGDTTTCVDLDFMEAVRDKLTLFQHTDAIDIQRRMKQLFENNYHYEYTVRNSDGKLQALMVISADDLDYHVGKPCLVVEMACSLSDGLLQGGYRWVLELAKHHGLEWIRYTRTDGDTVTCKYKKIRVDPLK